MVGLIATIWNGTGDDTTVLSTIWEGDSKHGGNMQASLLFKNFHAKVLATRVVPEALVISADNTPKETKNSIVYVWMIWMLCCFRSTPLWRIRTVYKLVGHTHSHCDRLFSRVKASLMGKSYFSEEQMAEVIISTLRSYNLQWNHLGASLDFESLKRLLGIEIHHLRNVHDLEVFRTSGGIYCRWKQYLSDELWSRPRLIISGENMATVASARPPHIKHKFTEDAKGKFQDFLNKIEMQLSGMGILDHKAQAGMAWLRNVTQVDSDHTMPIDDMISDILNGGAPIGAIRPDGGAVVPDDLLLLNCPGHVACQQVASCIDCHTSTWLTHVKLFDSAQMNLSHFRHDMVWHCPHVFCHT